MFAIIVCHTKLAMGPSFWNIVFIIHQENAGNDRLNITLHHADYRLPQIH
jgi:hypothetical protein